MKTLIACDCPDIPGTNHYVAVLRDALIARGVDVRADLVEFWNPSCHYDIVHFQWPEAVSLQGKHPSILALAALKARIAAYKRDGTKFVITRHNERPHQSVCPEAEELYRLVESSCDAIIHMGEYSRRNMPSSHCSNNARHYVVPHHVYTNINRGISQSEAKAELKIKPTSKLLLAFGDFRSDAEKWLVVNAWKGLRKFNIKLLAPRMFQNPVLGKGKLAAIREIKYRLRFLRSGFFPKTGGAVSDQLMSVFFAAADIVMIPRLQILNSGNLPMGFYFGKVVVGPNTGNVGEILHATGNPTFAPNIPESASAAVREGLNLESAGKGEDNRSYAMTNWHPDRIAIEVERVYNEIASEAPSCIHMNEANAAIPPTP